MALTRVPEIEAKLYDALRESFTKTNRDGLHLTDLLQPRKYYWKQLDPQPITDAEIGFFTGGLGHEDALSRLLADHFEETPEESCHGIHCRPDWVAKSDGIIPKGDFAELKTRRSNLPKSDAEANDPVRGLTYYRKQVRGYMALKHRERMWLVVLSLTEGKTRDPLSSSAPVFAVYREDMTEAELAEELDNLTAIKILLESPASHTQMPLCEAWMCGKWNKALVRDGGAWSYYPKCAWYDKCKPYETDPSRGTHRDPILLAITDKYKVTLPGGQSHE